MRVVTSLLLTSVLVFNCARVHAHADHRKEELSRIKNYELVSVHVADLETSQTVSFAAFGQQYDIELIENEDMAPATIRHTNGLPTDHDVDHEYFTSPTTKSCHYFGKVINDNTGALQYASLSLCPGRGIRGEVYAFDETIVIKPAKYLLDTAFDSAHPHDISDEHLVYKLSDFALDSEPEPELELDGELSAELDDSDYTEPDFTDVEVADIDAEQKNTQRRNLLSFNNNNNKIEMLYLIDPGLRAYYVRTYTSNWYTQLVQDMTDRVNTVSSRYKASNFKDYGFGSNGVSVNFVEIEVIESWTGNYATLEPVCKKHWPCETDPSDANYPCECQIYPHDLRRKMLSFVRDYKDTSTFDSAMILTRHSLAGVYGMAQICNICNSYWAIGLVSAAPARSDAGIIKNMQHELGHNLGAKDNGDGNTCSSGIMGGGGNTFGSCALSRIESICDSNDCTCLGDGVNSFKTNVNENAIDSCPHDYGTVCLSGIRSSYIGGQWLNFNGEWFYVGCKNGAAMYQTKNGEYSMWRAVSNGIGKYRISSSGGKSLLCTADNDNVLACNNRWKYRHSDGRWYSDSSSSTYDCSSGAALNIVEDACDNYDIYGNDGVLCVNNAVGLEVGYNVSTWMRMEAVCENEMPVYAFTVQGSNLTYYLRFEERQLYSDSDVLYPQWLISADDAELGADYAYCEERDLMSCTHGNWYAVQQENGTDYAEYLVVQSMAIMSNDECVNFMDDFAEKNENWMQVNPTTATLAVLLLVVLCLVLMVCAAYCMHRRFMKTKQLKKKVKEMVPDEEEMGIQEDEEIEVEMDVNVAGTQTRYN